MKTGFFWILLVCSAQVKAVYEYLYPVAAVSGLTMVMHQDQHGKLNLLSWDQKTGVQNVLLPSYYCPAGVRILPCNNGFSFVDNERIRVKLFTQRSPASYDYAYPLHSLAAPVWSADGMGYYTACYRGHYGIFTISIDDKEGDCILTDAARDYLYPQCLDGTLYCIERNLTCSPAHYAIKSMPIVHKNSSHDVYDIERLIFEEDEAPGVRSSTMLTTVLDFGQMPVMHLVMVDQTFGWVIGLPSDLDGSLLTFACYCLHQLPSGWHSAYAFSFSLPRELIFGDSATGRLYESLDPLLPRYMRDHLYYCSADASGFTGIYRYNKQSHVCERVTPPCELHLFCPLDLGKIIVYGGRVLRDSLSGARPSMDVDGKIVLPYIV